MMLRILIYLILWGTIYVIDGSSKTTFILLSSLITISSSIEALLMYLKYGLVALLSPFVICCIYMFAISFGISNFIFAIPGYEKFYEYFIYDHFGNFENFFTSFCHGLNYVIVGFFSLLLGYKVEERTKIISRATQNLFQGKYLLVKSYDIQLWKIIFLWIISSLTKIYAIAKGIYGFTASSIALEQNQGIIQFLNYGIVLSKGALFFLCLLYFTKPKNSKITFWLITIIAVELVFGLLSGFKSQLFFPFIILLFANLVITRKIKIKFVIPIFLSLFLAYALVEPMRAASYGYQSDKKVGASELIEMATVGVKQKAITEENALPFFYVFMYRNSLGVFLAISENNVNHQKRYYPHFDVERKMFFAPVLAYIPRVIWPDKPIISNGGVLYNREVLGAPDTDNVSVATSPFGYFLLGTHKPIFYIILFFFLLGMLQYYIYLLFREYGLGGLIVCVGLLMTFGIIEEPYSVIIAYFKELPIFILFQFLFLYKFKTFKKTQVAVL